MFKKMLMGLVIIVIGFCVFVATRPDDFRVTRSLLMQAPADTVFAQVNDFHAWQAWSPWAKKDPNAQFAYEGAASGLGAGFRWSGNKDVGEGIMTIVESRPSQLIRIRLDFLKPFKATNTSEFTLTQEGQATSVSWSMYGKNNFIGKAIGVFIDCDKMVGADFEKGLANLKSIVETR